MTETLRIIDPRSPEMFDISSTIKSAGYEVVDMGEFMPYTRDSSTNSIRVTVDCEDASTLVDDVKERFSNRYGMESTTVIESVGDYDV